MLSTRVTGVPDRRLLSKINKKRLSDSDFVLSKHEFNKVNWIIKDGTYWYEIFFLIHKHIGCVYRPILGLSFSRHSRVVYDETREF